MEIIVCVKQVLDTRIPLEVTQCETGSDVQWIPGPLRVMNPSDRAALEEAIALRGICGGRVTVLTLGGTEADEVLRTCLARGADRAVHILDASIEDAPGIAKGLRLSRAVAALAGDIVLCASRSSDKGSGQVPPTLAEMLGLPCVTNVVRLTVDAKLRTAIAERRLDRGYRQEIECKLPAVFGVETAIHEARYVSVHAERLALKRKVEQWQTKTLGIDADLMSQAQLRLKGVSPPRPRPKKTPALDSSLSAEDRIKALMSGGHTEKKTSQSVAGLPAEVAAKVVEFLKTEGLLL